MKSCYLASGNLIMVVVTNKLLDVTNEIPTAVNTRIRRYYARCTGTQVPRLGGNLESQSSGLLPQTWMKKVSPKGS